MAVAAAEDLAKRVLILANNRDPESVQLAQFYADQRSVPYENIIFLPMPGGEAIGWRDFIGQIYQPLQDELVRRGWIDAMGSTLTDRLGRKRYSILGHRIAYLVVCRGVPWRIDHDPSLMEEKLSRVLPPPLRSNGAAVDSELSLLAQSEYEITATRGNPLFACDRPSSLETDLVVKVARLDGPTLNDAEHLVTSALEGERTGLLGRSYVDLGGPNPDGDRWLESVAAQLEELGFAGDVERSGATLGKTARFDAPVLYFGWYAGEVNGPFVLDGFRFPAGAIAMHIQSFSAASLHSATAGWCGPLVARGVAATAGNVAEPYLEYTHRPSLLLRTLAQGWTLGDAAYYALPVLSWQSLLLGDPLYRPFAVSLASTLAASAQLPEALAPYAVLRQMNLLVRQGRASQALKVARVALSQYHHPALALATAKLAWEKGDKTGATKALQFMQVLTGFSVTEWALAREIAGWLASHGARSEALHVYVSLAHSPPPTPEGKIALLVEARAVADAAGVLPLSVEWTRQIEELSSVGKK